MVDKQRRGPLGGLAAKKRIQRLSNDVVMLLGHPDNPYSMSSTQLKNLLVTTDAELGTVLREHVLTNTLIKRSSKPDRYYHFDHDRGNLQQPPHTYAGQKLTIPEYVKKGIQARRQVREDAKKEQARKVQERKVVNRFLEINPLKFTINHLADALGIEPKSISGHMISLTSARGNVSKGRNNTINKTTYHDKKQREDVPLYDPETHELNFNDPLLRYLEEDDSDGT